MTEGWSPKWASPTKTAGMDFHVSDIGRNNYWNDVHSKRINCMHNTNITVKRMNGILYPSEAKMMMQSLVVSPRLFHKQCPSSLVTTPIITQKMQFADILLKFVPQNSNWIGGAVMLFNGIITPCIPVSAVSWVALNYGHRPTMFNICVFMCHTVGFCLMPMSYNVVLQCTRNVIVQRYDVAMLLCTRMSSNKARFGSCQQLFIIPRTT